MTSQLEKFLQSLSELGSLHESDKIKLEEVEEKAKYYKRLIEKLNEKKNIIEHLLLVEEFKTKQVEVSLSKKRRLIDAKNSSNDKLSLIYIEKCNNEMMERISTTKNILTEEIQRIKSEEKRIVDHFAAQPTSIQTEENKIKINVLKEKVTQVMDEKSTLPSDIEQNKIKSEQLLSKTTKLIEEAKEEYLNLQTQLENAKMEQKANSIHKMMEEDLLATIVETHSLLEETSFCKEEISKLKKEISRKTSIISNQNKELIGINKEMKKVTNFTYPLK